MSKRKTFSLFLLIFAVCSLHFSANSGTNPPSSTAPSELFTPMTVANATSHLSLLADDKMMGRNTPSPELERAADYIAEQFQKFGLEKVNGTYFHTYKLQRIELGKENSCSVLSEGNAEVQLTIKDDFIPLEQTGPGTLTNAAVVFVGYGITAEEFQYDDYKNIDVKDKVVLMMSGEPNNPDDTVFFAGKRMTRYARGRAKINNALKHGASGILIVNNPTDYRSKLRPSGFGWPSLYNLPSESLPLSLPSTESKQVPATSIGEKAIKALLGSVENLKSLQKDIDSLKSPHSFVIEKAKLSLRISLKTEEVPLRNVMGIVRGSELPDEYVVVGGHYDHIGFTRPNNPATDSISNGADDNASGTTGVLMMAEAFAKSKRKPKRSMLFLAFSGEEKGLLGSRAFVDSSPIDTKKMAAMFNLDMIGRGNNDSLSIGGNTRCPELTTVNEEENAATAKPFHLAYDIESFFFRSDQASFAKRKIPVLFFFTGEHEDYHKVTDHVAKINFPKLVRIVELCSRTAWRVADLDGRLPYKPQANDE